MRISLTGADVEALCGKNGEYTPVKLLLDEEVVELHIHDDGGGKIHYYLSCYVSDIVRTDRLTAEAMADHLGTTVLLPEDYSRLYF